MLNYLQNGMCSFIFMTLVWMQPPLKSPPKIHSSTSVNFHHAVSPLLFKKSSLRFPLTLRFSIPQQFFTSLFFRTTIPATYTKNIFPTPAIQQTQAMESWEEWQCFNLSFLSLSMNSENRAHNHWFLIGQAQKIGVLQKVVSDEDVCNSNGKQSSSFSLIPSTFCQYFRTLLLTSQELTFLNLFKLIFILRLAFSYSIHAPLHPYV